MELKHGVCTLEQAMELDRLGLKAVSYLWWTDYGTGRWELMENSVGGDGAYPAYSCAELGVLLPETIIHLSCNGYLQIDNQLNQFLLYYSSPGKRSGKLIGGNIRDYEAHARAGLLIRLLKEKIVSPEDLTLEKE